MSERCNGAGLALSGARACATPPSGRPDSVKRPPEIVDFPRTETHDLREIVSGNSYIVSGNVYIVNGVPEIISDRFAMVRGKKYIVNDFREIADRQRGRTA